ncbi:CRM-domain containing factor CFM9, mitochondrial isoform X2 [Humulus lupulus]|uniref:CRM-domain containing factor CFM9, mitochondrial isoform X2 n=1 Tax=Humulus lupulus TaxID=3486 RepID=UPI002B404D34|nr:CRM-domain containing factor CFM9, mitochondrial isoform X2 [Humulus lupulus]
MLAARNLHRHTFKNLSPLLHSASSNDLLCRKVAPKIVSSNVVQPSNAREDGLFFSSSTMLLDPFNTWCRSMSTPRGRSMRSKVEQRMKKESGKTLREVRRAKKIQKKLMTESERHVYNLKRAKRKVALLLQKLKKYELPDLPPPRHDPELFTPEQLQAFKKIGFKNKNYVPVGVRGVFGGVVQNMHLHWKFHETVQVCCDNFPKERIKEMATMLARLSGGIVINIHNVKTIIMFRGRNYRQPKNLIPINTLTKRKALFKARFEQALESQKLNIKKIEQQLRRSGINPEDPVATASIQRVASSFFNAIDKKEGTPYVFQEDKLSLRDSTDFESSEPSDEKEQEELDKFIAEIEDAAEREWAAEEAAEKEDFGRLKYWNREEFGGRFRRAETFRGDSSYDENRGDRNWKDSHGKRRTSESDDEDDDASDADDKWRSRNARGATPVDSDIDESDESEENFEVHRGDRRRQERISRPRNNEGYKRNAPINFRKSMPEEDSDEENVLSDLETTMRQSDTDEEHGSSAARATNYNYRSDSDEEEDSFNQKEEKGRRMTYESSGDDSDECNRLEAPKVVKGRRRMTYESSADDSDECNRLEAPKVVKGRGRMTCESSDDDSDVSNRLEAPRVVKGRQNRAGSTGNTAASSHSEIAWLEEEDTEALGGGNLDYWSSGDEDEYQVKSDGKEKTDARRSKSAKEVDETWDSD